MDNAIWAVWYDLDPELRESHFDWLHGTYLPAIVARSGIAWAAHYAAIEDMYKEQRDRLFHTDEPIPQGTQFILLIGAASPHNFFLADSPLLEENLTPETRTRLAERSEARTMAFVEEERVAGVEFGHAIPGGVPGPAIQIGSFNMTSPEQDIEIGKWYAQLRMPFLSQVPGAIRTRKLASIVGWAKHCVLYEFTSHEAREKNVVKPYNAFSAKVIPETVHAPGSPATAERIWPPV